MNLRFINFTKVIHIELFEMESYGKITFSDGN